MSVYNKKILMINAKKKTFEALNIREELFRKLIGGKGLGAYLLYKFGVPRSDSFDEKNPIILASGPLNNTRIPLTSKVGFFFKSPITGGYGESYVGGSLPRYPKALGYDAIVVIGKFDRPTIVVFHEDGVSFEDASDYWGMGIINVDNALRKIYGARATVVSIGPAGENLVRYACISVDKWRQAGRSGGGAVLGAKNIKAMVFVGGEFYVEPKNLNAFGDVLSEVIDRIKNYSGKKYFTELGTSAMVTIANEMGFFPTYYWQDGIYESWENIGPKAVKKLLKKPHACWNCPFACGRYVEFVWNNKKFEMDGLEYETIYALGGLIGVNDINGVAYLNYLADDLGLDVISLGNVLGFAVVASKLGKLDLDIFWGNIEKFAELIRDIAYRRGIGDLLAEGVARVADKIGLNDVAIHVKGLEPAGYDPRTLKAMSLAYAVSPRGACHLRAMGYIIDIRRLAGDPEEITKKKVEKIVEFEEWMASFDSLIVCKFARDVYDLELMLKMVNAATGFELNMSEYRLALKRIIILTRLINEREGFGRKKDLLPVRFFKEKLKIDNEERVLTEEEFTMALDYYYELMGIDKKSGIIRTETLEKLGLDKVLEGKYIG